MRTESSRPRLPIWRPACSLPERSPRPAPPPPLGCLPRLQEMKIDDVDKVWDEINDQTDQMRQIQDAMAQPIGAAADIDEDELLGELEVGGWGGAWGAWEVRWRPLPLLPGAAPECVAGIRETGSRLRQRSCRAGALEMVVFVRVPARAWCPHMARLHACWQPAAPLFQSSSFWEPIFA